LLGNDDDGIFGEQQVVPYSTNISTKTFLRWSSRNPMHNCFFYTLGSAGWTNHHCLVLADIDSREGPKLFSTGQGRISGRGRFGFRVAFHDYKPFISWNIPFTSRQRFEFYLGWRQRGNLGIKFKPFVRYESPGLTSAETPERRRADYGSVGSLLEEGRGAATLDK
jgi:hypothetical protein